MKSKALLRWWILALFLSAVLVFPPDIGQATTLDFGMTAPTAGMVSYAGGSAALIGTGINVVNLLGTGTPSNSGVTLTCSGCALNFNTGDLSNTGTWTWTGTSTNNSITLNGTLLDASNNTVASGVLLTGSFGTASVFGNGGSFNLVGSLFNDTKNANILAFYGLSPSSFSGGLNLSFSINPAVVSGSPFQSAQLYSGDVVNTPVPEPASLLLLGSGLAGLGLWGLKRQKDVQA